MKIISFAWTTDVLLSGKKTATRREWTDDYANRFQKNDLVQAYDKSPRFGGKRIATIQLTKKPFKQRLGDLTHKDFIAEGGYVLWASLDDFAGLFSPDYDEDKELWVIEFILISTQPKQPDAQLMLF